MKNGAPGFRQYAKLLIKASFSGIWNITWFIIAPSIEFSNYDRSIVKKFPKVILILFNIEFLKREFSVFAVETEFSSISIHSI